MLLVTSFTLSKPYLEECFDETLPYSKLAKPRYLFIAVLLLSGMALLIFTQENTLAACILLGLGILEMISFYYRRAWWLTRQMWSRSADSTVTISLDKQGFSSKNPYTETRLEWTDIKNYSETSRGIIFFTHKGGQSYLSKSVLTPEIIAVIQERCYLR